MDRRRIERHRTHPTWHSVKQHGRHIKFIVYCAVLLFTFLTFPTHAVHAQTLQYVTHEFSYPLPEAGEIFLVWGIDGWTVVPEGRRPSGTFVKDSLMHTPMIGRDGIFTAKVEIPLGARIDYGFLITKRRNGTGLQAIWDGSLDVIALQDGRSEAQPSPSVLKSMAADRLHTRLFQVGIVLAGAYLVLGTVFTRRHTLSTENTDPTLRILVPFSSRQGITIVATFALLNLLTLAGTALFLLYYRRISGLWEMGSQVKYLLIQFYLVEENVIASWYSSMLLLMVSIALVLCFVADKQNPHLHRKGTLIYGWLLVAFIFAGLSLDEIGSIHERGGAWVYSAGIGRYFPSESAILMLPLGAVAVYLLAFAWLHLRHNRRVLMLMGLGILLFIVVLVVEHIEEVVWNHELGESLSQTFVLFTLLEEGAELFGTLCFLGAALCYLAAAAVPHHSTHIGARPGIEFNVKPKTAYAGAVVAIGLLALGMIGTLLLPHVGDGDGGIPQNWFPSALAALAALVCLQIWDTASGHSRQRSLGSYEQRGAGLITAVTFTPHWASSTKRAELYLVLSLLSALISIYFGANIRVWLSFPELSIYLFPQLADLLVIALALGAGVLVAVQVDGWWSRIGVFLWALLLSLALGMGGTSTPSLAFAAFSVLLPALLAHLWHWQPSFHH